jgi:preprotein translocase SecE subunit
MAIRQTASQTLVDTELNQNTTSSNPEKKLDSKKSGKKLGFTASVVDELRKVEWPTLSYTVNWSVIIVVFAAIFSLAVGLIDNVFNSGIKYVNCTVPIVQSTDKNSDENKTKWQGCSGDLVKNLSFRG